MPTTLPTSLNRTLTILVAFALAMGVMAPMLAPAPTRAATPSDLFFSEYIEGSSFNKALEIYNGTGAAVDLSAYTVELYSNGSGTVSQSVDLSGSLADGDVFVLAHADASSAITGVADLLNSAVVNFNGDDAVVLRKGGARVDVIGQVGFDPGSAWGTDVETANQTLVRKPTVAAGDPDGSDAFDPAIEWIGYPENTFNFLGSHTFSSEPVQTDPSGAGSATPASVAPGGSTTLSVSVVPGTNPTSTGLTVTADLSPIGGSSTQVFTAAGANLFTFEATVDPSIVPGDKVITATIADAEGRSASVEISLTMIEDVAGTVVISQVYGGGGNSGATLTNDFVELFNRSDAPVSLEGWSVQYASTSGTSWQVTELSGSIAAGGYYLVGEAAGTGGSVPLPALDAVGSISMSATNGKVALSPSTASLAGSCPLGSVADFVGFGTANCFEGTGATPGLNNETAALRDEDGCQDTDDNAADFATGDPTPRNSASPLTSCSGVPVDAAPTVTSTFPIDGSVNVATDESIGVTFSEAVTVASNWYQISCSVSGSHSATVTGGPSSYAIDPDSDFVAGDQCTVTVFAASVTDDDAIDPPDTMAADKVFSFSVGTLSCGSPTHFIHEVQGAGPASPIEGSTVTVEGVVVGDYQGNDPGLSGFFIQEEAADADANPLTSEGIFVFDGFDPVPVSVGDVVSVTAEVDEFFGQTELTDVIAVTPCGTTADIAPTEVALPVTAIDDLEAFEGMLVSFDQTLTVTETFGLGRFGEVVLSADGRQFQGTHVAAPGDPAAAVDDLNARSRIVLDDGDGSQNDDPTRYPTGGLSAENTLRVGSTVDDLTAVLAFDHGLYRLQPVGEITFEGGERPDGPPDVGGRIQVASFNVLNYFNGNGDGTGFDAPEQRGAENSFEFDRQRTKIINAISVLDAEVVGLMEIENDGDADYPAIADLVDGLNAKLGAGTYDYIEAGRVGTDAIAVAIIYQPSAVSPLGDFAVLDSSVDPRFDEDRNRAALAQTFVENATGAAFTVAVNHLKSKGSACGPGDDQPDSRGGNCNETRTRAAAALADWLAGDPTGAGDADAVIIGDLNSYAMEDPISVLHDAGFTDLLAEFEGLHAYTYVFEGASGYLDHAQANASLAPQVTDAAAWHINADEPPVLDYNTNFKTPNHVQTLYAPDPFRSSDHDPVVIGLDLVLHAPTITSVDGPDDPIEVGEGATVTATFGDVDGGETHTATIDWGDGSVTQGVVNQDSDSVAGSHAYSAAGLYEVTVEVTDSGGLSDADSQFPVIVYDTEAGFVTGGGRVDIPDGTASFEVSIKYQKGANSPEGAFSLELPTRTFEATSIDWLVVSGSSAWAQGDGTLDGVAGYEFLLAVNDGPDRMRVKIWSASDANDVLLDTQAGDPIDAAPTNPITNGQIKVHQNKGPAVTASRHRR